MVRYFKISAIIFIVFSFGLFLGKQFETETDRVALGIELFEKYCVPMAAQDTSVAEMDMTELVLLGTGVDWAHTKSKMIISLERGQCAVSDALLMLTSQERSDFKMMAETLIGSRFPMLQPDENHGLYNWDVFQLWASHERNDPRRWVVGFSRNSSDTVEPIEQHLSAVTSLLIRWPMRGSD